AAGPDRACVRGSGSWSQCERKSEWRLSMKHPSPRLPPPSPRLAGRGVPIWFMVPMHAKNERGLPMNRSACGPRPQRPQTINFVAADVRRLILFRGKEVGASLRRLLRFTDDMGITSYL